LTKKGTRARCGDEESFLESAARKIRQRSTGYRGDNTSQKSQETRYNLNPLSFFVNHFWGRWPDGVAINEALQIEYILEFKRTIDRDEGFLEVKEADAMSSTKASSVRSEQLLQSGNLNR